MIKVTETKMHKLSPVPRGITGDIIESLRTVPVAEGKIVLVECKPDEAKFWLSAKGTLCIYLQEYGLIWGTRGYLKPIIISETEKIEVGDWFYWHDSDGETKLIAKSIGTTDETHIKARSDNEFGYGDWNIEYANKILAFPEHFSPKHLQDIVDGKLKDRDKVLIECEEWATVKSETKWIYAGSRFKIDSVYVQKSQYNPEFGRNLRLSLIGTSFGDQHKSTVIWEKDLIIDCQILITPEDHITLHKIQCDFTQCNNHCKLAANAFGKIHECHTNGCVVSRIETNSLHKIEDTKLYTKEERDKAIWNFIQQYYQDDIRDPIETLDQLRTWFEQNVK